MDRQGVVLVAVAVAGIAGGGRIASAQRVRESREVVAIDSRETGDAKPQAVARAEQNLSTDRSTDNISCIAMQERWQDVPQQRRLKLSVQIVDGVTALGNLIGTGMNELSDDMIGLQFDGRRRRARLRLGTGAGQFLRFRFESDWHFTGGKARIAAKVQLGIGNHQWNIELPDMEMAPTSVRGESGVELRIPLFERRW